MQHAYSILLSETLTGEQLHYRDCEKLQAVCPSCREPVHLVIRRQSLVRGWKRRPSKPTAASNYAARPLPALLTSVPAAVDEALSILLPAATSNEQPVDEAVEPAPGEITTEKPILKYFRHYNRDKSYDEACALRVSAMQRTGELQRLSVASRDQKLKFFLDVLADSIDRLHAEHPAFAKPSGRPITEAAASLARSKSVARLRDLLFAQCREHARGGHPAQTITADFDAFLARTKNTRFEFTPTSLSVETHKLIASDVWRHLLTAKARPNFDLMFNYAYLATHEQLIEAANSLRGGGLAAGIRRIARASADLQRTSINGADRIIDAIATQRATVPLLAGGEAERTLLSLWTYNLSNQCLGSLIMLPYYELLARASATLQKATA